MQFDRQKLAGRIVEKFGTRRKFAEAVGLSESAVSYKLNGRVKISAEDIYLWSSEDLLDIPAEMIGDFFCAPKFQ